MSRVWDVVGLVLATVGIAAAESIGWVIDRRRTRFARVTGDDQ